MGKECTRDGQLITDIRKRAEELLSGNYNLKKITYDNIDEILQELVIHQAELEIQNEELRRTQSEVEASRNKYSDLYDFAPIAYFTIDKHALIVEVNMTGSTFVGMDRRRLLKKSFQNFVHTDYQTKFSAHLQAVQSHGKSLTEELLLVCDNGSERWVSMESIPHEEPDGTVRSVRSALIDITGKKKREEELHRLNRTLKALSKSSQAMIRAKNESEYLQEVCRIIVEDCGHAMLWVGYAEEDEDKTVRPVSYSGFEEGYLETLKLTWADTERGRGPTGTAIRTGKVSTCRNMLIDPLFKPWREEALKRGYASSIVFPLMDNGKAFGAITIYSREPDPFSENEVTLLSELADDLVFGIIAIRLRDAHEQAEKTIQYLAKFPEENPSPVLRLANDSTLLYANKASSLMLENWNCQVGDLLIGKVKGITLECLNSENREVEVYCSHKVFSLIFAKVADVNYVNVYGRDITEHKWAEESLRESEERFKAITSSTPDHILVQDRELRYSLVVNPQLGLSVQDMIGKTDFDILSKEEAETLTKIKRQVLEIGNPVHLEMPLISLQGGQQFFDGSYIPKFDAKGRVDGLIGYFRNVTERKLAEEKLKKSEELYRSLFENMLNGFAYCRMLFENGHPIDFVYLNVNEAFETLTGLKNVTGKRVTEVIPGITQSDPGLIETYGRVALTGKPERFETYVEALKQWFSISVYSPEKEYFVAVFDVITERKQAEEELHNHRERLEELVIKRTQELEDKNLQLHKEMIERVLAEEEKKGLEIQLIQAQRMEALGKLAGGIAHDLNNILQPILINSEMISDKLPQGTQERDYLDQIIDVAQLGRNLIKQIKMFGSSQKPILKPIPIGQVVHKALSIVKRTLSSDIKFRDHISMNGYLVNADPFQINQLVINLCSNAVQSMTPQGGALDVSLDETEVIQSAPAIGNDLKPGKYMILTVSDTGSGISPEIMKNIFDPFFTTRKSDKGTGLGLAVVYEVVKNSQGSMLVNSEVGKGTRFEIFFPTTP
jgi:PAS domain S-box-containing protein